MKYLNWLKNNINFVSVVTGLVLVASGKTEIGKILINHGGAL